MPAADSQRDFALSVVRRLRDAGHEALWAGGCVRDQLLGREPKDYDVATSARPEAVRALFGERRTLAIGASFGVITVLGRRPLEPIEVATFRSDGAYRDGRRPESVVFTDAEHDAQRRDFTINGLFFDPVANRVVDYVGGVADLEGQVIRAIGDPRQRFTEDKLRLLRAVRFAATFDFAIEPVTLAAIREMASDVTAVSVERIAAELRRILTHPSRRRGVELLTETGLLRPLMPELDDAAAKGETTWCGSLERLARLGDASFPLALAALVADATDGEGARRIGRRLKLSNKEVDRTTWLVNALPLVRRAAELPWPQLQRLLAHDGGADLMALAKAALPDGDPGIARCQAEMARPEHEWNPPPLVTGDDLIAAGLKAGRHFSDLLERLRDEQLAGRLRTRDEAIEAARRWSPA